MIKVISFDLDDTLSDSRFDKLLWDVEIPQSYAKEHGITFEEANQHVQNEYTALWGTAIGDWRDASFWLKHFKLKTTWEELLQLLESEIMHFDDTVPVLEELSKEFKLIIISNAERKFLDAKLRLNNIERFFYKTYSASSDFNLKDKSTEAYKKVLEDLQITPEEIIHVGDDKTADVETPKKIGIRAFLISRDGKTPNADFTNLIEFKKHIVDSFK